MRSSGGAESKKKAGNGTIPGSVQSRRSFLLVLLFFFIFGTIIFMFYLPVENDRRMVKFNKHGVHRDYEDNIPIQKKDKDPQLPQYPYNLTPKEREWQTVNGSIKSKFFVYAAYVDRREEFRGVRIIAATKRVSPDRVWCRLWYRNEMKNSSAAYISRTIPAKNEAIGEHHDKEYSAYYVLCPLPKHKFPTLVSIVTDARHPPSNLLAVMDNFNAAVTYNLTVCVLPLHSYYNLYLDVLEFFELYMLLGVTHFTIYNQTAGPQASCVLRHYVDRGLLSLIPWHLDLVAFKDIHGPGIMAGLNECLHRYMYKAAYTIFIDLDEHIVPRHHETIPEFIEYWNSKLGTRNIGTFLFQNGFYYRGFENDEYVRNLTDPVAANLLSVSKTKRMRDLNPFGVRSKFIAKPERVVVVGNHCIHQMMPGYETYNVPSSSAISNHYRHCDAGWDCNEAHTVVDRATHKYKEKLMRRVRSQFDKLKDECNLSSPRFPSRKAPELAATLDSRH